MINEQDPNRANKHNAPYDSEERRRALAAHIIRAGLEEHIDSARLILDTPDKPSVSDKPKEALDESTEPSIPKTILRIE